MRYVVAVWAIPLIIFWGWFGLSYYDMNFGYVMLTRQVHDLLFGLYGEMLGIDPVTIPWLLVKACVFDSLFLAAIMAFRARKKIAARYREWRDRYRDAPSAPSA